ncbi:short-chain dehydrogenase [Virgibacillus soli]|uniref:Short-chain dehydrogenase n=1 Tax=Paracerasibacillus soli TaxID=480284 RepID=A0ABU5CVT3_9BACI|nr:short-chain dehydrogenase [Virgibacillus soli]MDY0409555.1 short-chain dehydrogenase [Virgibacillus soli]
MENLQHALVIGGTGMLQKTCLWLADNNYMVTVINRHKNHFEQMVAKSKAPAHFHNLLVDYHDEEKLEKKLKQTFDLNGPPQLVISWIHSSAPQALPLIIDTICRYTNKWQLIHIQGSSSFFVKEQINIPKDCTYQQVYLGFVMDEKGSRWLTNDEISNGVLKAMKLDHPKVVVGTLEPWHQRPSSS